MLNTIQIAIILFFTMFIYSGLNKINNFNKKVSILQSKTRLPHFINVLGMFGVMNLEVFGSIIMILYFLKNKFITYDLTRFVNILFLLFLVVVTMLYHPPWDKKIPFLSNLTTFAGLLIIYEMIRHKNKLY